MARTIVMCGLVLLTASCASVPPREGPDPKLTAATQGLVPGKPVQCISNDEAGASEPFDGGLIYQGRFRNRIYVNTSPGCRRFGNDDIPVTRIYSSQLCRGDRVSFVDRSSGIFGGQCILGDFTPYRKPG